MRIIFVVAAFGLMSCSSQEPPTAAHDTIALPNGFGLTPVSFTAPDTTPPLVSARPPTMGEPGLYPGETRQIRKLINKWADYYDVPRTLVHRVVQRESDYRANARNGPYYGLMQILPQTAQTMGFNGTPRDLLDADTNLRYAVKYLRGAWLVSNGNEASAVSWYARGYYYEARNRCMLRETGLRDTEVRSVCG